MWRGDLAGGVIRDPIQCGATSSDRKLPWRRGDLPVVYADLEPEDLPGAGPRTHDRDVNAAKNIEAEGLRVLMHPEDTGGVRGSFGGEGLLGRSRSPWPYQRESVGHRERCQEQRERRHAPETWKTNRWVDTSNFASESTHTGHESWVGCVMDRAHSPADPKTSAGLSLELPGDTGGAFPAFMYPDSNRLDPAILDAMRDKVLVEFDEGGVASALGADEVRASIVAAGDNPWGAAVGNSDELVGGPNFHCTRVAMLPLSTDAKLVDETLDALYDPDLDNKGLWGGVTMSHLG